MNTLRIEKPIATTDARPLSATPAVPRSRVDRVGAIDLLAMLIATAVVMTMGALLSGWPVLDRFLLLSAVSFGATAPWLYSTMISGTARSVRIRLLLFVPVMLASFVGSAELLAACFFIHSIAAVQAAAELKGRVTRPLLLAWSGAAMTLSVLSLVTTV